MKRARIRLRIGASPLWCGVFAIAAGTGCSVNPPDESGTLQARASHEAAILEWRQRRDERLQSEDGWLTLVGLDWLQDGANTVGSGPGNRIRLPGGPEAWGTVYVGADGIRFERAPAAPVTVAGAVLDVAGLVPDDEGREWFFCPQCVHQASEVDLLYTDLGGGD